MYSCVEMWRCNKFSHHIKNFGIYFISELSRKSLLFYFPSNLQFSISCNQYLVVYFLDKSSFLKQLMLVSEARNERNECSLSIKVGGLKWMGKKRQMMKTGHFILRKKEVITLIACIVSDWIGMDALTRNMIDLQ